MDQRISHVEQAMERAFGEIATSRAETRKSFERVESQISEVSKQVATIVTTATTLARAFKVLAWVIGAAVGIGSFVVAILKLLSMWGIL